MFLDTPQHHNGIEGGGVGDAGDGGEAGDEIAPLNLGEFFANRRIDLWAGSYPSCGWRVPFDTHNRNTGQIKTFDAKPLFAFARSEAISAIGPVQSYRQTRTLKIRYCSSTPTWGLN